MSQSKNAIRISVREEIGYLESVMYDYGTNVYLSEHEIIANHLSFLLLSSDRENHCSTVLDPIIPSPQKELSIDYLHDSLVLISSRVKSLMEDDHEVCEIQVEPHGDVLVITKLSFELIKEREGV